jgi:hypothetical protein
MIVITIPMIERPGVMVPRNAAAPGSNRGEATDQVALATREDDTTNQCGCTRSAGDFWLVDTKTAFRSLGGVRDDW